MIVSSTLRSPFVARWATYTRHVVSTDTSDSTQPVGLSRIGRYEHSYDSTQLNSTGWVGTVGEFRTPDPTQLGRRKSENVQNSTTGKNWAIFRRLQFLQS